MSGRRACQGDWPLAMVTYPVSDPALSCCPFHSCTARAGAPSSLVSIWTAASCSATTVVRLILSQILTLSGTILVMADGEWLSGDLDPWLRNPAPPNNLS